MRQLWHDPKLFNYFIMAIYLCASMRWAYYRQWADMFYWLSACAITATVTWGYRR